MEEEGRRIGKKTSFLRELNSIKQKFSELLAG
jgi:hypothetical protein